MIRVLLLHGDVPVQFALSSLHPAEQAVLRPTAVPKRVNDFVRGRWVARRLLSERFPALEGFAVLPTEGGVPQAHDHQLRRLSVSVSISHTVDYAAAALVDAPAQVGIDVEGWVVETIAREYFTPQEQSWCAGERRRWTGVWTLKEAMLKVAGQGLRWPLASVVVHGWDDAEGWCVARVSRGMRAWVRFTAEGAVAVAVQGVSGDAPPAFDVHRVWPL